MGKIHELTEVLADQIAAGEVIERPASIVKELVENSLDAHSHRIDILVEEAGLNSIRVIDDGQGIMPEDIEIAFKRHATSKITNRQDLFKVKTMGFRGEALPSIASVADVTLTSSTSSQEEGTMIHIQGGKLLQKKPATARPGTDVLVSNLFFNTPARLKYLKSPQTEMARITDIVNRLALANPATAFSLTHNGKEIFRTAGNGNLQQVVAAIYGVQVGRKMLAINGEDNDFKINGLVSLPELTRSSRQYLTITINHRYIRNFELTKSIISGYESKLMVGRFPVAVLNIDLDPVLVDVNVHPAKREVRLSKESELTELISQTIRKRIAEENLIPDVDTNQFIPYDEEVEDLNQRLKETSTSYEVTSTNSENNQLSKRPVEVNAEDSVLRNPIVIRSTDELNSAKMKQFDERYQSEGVIHPFGDNPDEQAPTQSKRAENIELDVHDKSDKAKKRFPDLQYIGQLQGTFLLAQASDGLYIVDQHAAQERINFERYRKEIGEVSDDQQTFLVPLVLNYSTVDAMTISQHLETLKAVGLHLETFGPNSFIIRSHPTWFKEGQEESTVKEIIEWLIDDGKISVSDFRMKTAIMMSCKRAIKANHHLDEREAKALLTRLPQCENPFNCPHGRPVTIHFDDRDLEKMFKRIQDSHEAFSKEYNEHEF
ncbi:DNA mismatch repair endonuclease MutL [Lactobacillaceae bacterium 24-114]